MSLDDTVQARAGKPPEPNNDGIDDLYAAIVALSDRLSAIEAKPLARDGRDGAPGRDGGIGACGEPGIRGEAGPQGAPGPGGRGIVSAEINAEGELLLVMTDGEVLHPGRVVGRDGQDGLQGEVGPRGEQGLRGETGPQGEVGEVGPQGEQGIRGEAGPQGIRGEAGPQGEAGVSVKSAAIDDDALYLTLSDGTSVLAGTDLRGPQGDAGPAGSTGPRGEAGLSVIDASVTADGDLTLTLSDKSGLIAGNVRGPQGLRGEAGPKGEHGEPGTRGDVGPQGEAGVSVTDVAVSEDGILTMSLSNGTSLFLGSVRGPQGEAGPSGPQGELDESRLAMLVAPTIERQTALASAIASADIVNKLNSRIDQIMLHFAAPAQPDKALQPGEKSK